MENFHRLVSQVLNWGSDRVAICGVVPQAEEDSLIAIGQRSRASIAAEEEEDVEGEESDELGEGAEAGEDAADDADAGEDAGDNS